VFLFFGLAAVGGTYYVLTLQWDWLVLLIACIPGLHASALLAVNNLRDVDTDRAAGKRTLAARFGRTFGRWEYALLLLLPYLIVILLYTSSRVNSAAMLLSLLSLVPASRALRLAFRHTDGPNMIRALGGTVLTQLTFGILFAVGLAL